MGTRRQKELTWLVEDLDVEVDGAFGPGPTGVVGKQAYSVMDGGWMLCIWAGRKGTVVFRSPCAIWMEWEVSWARERSWGSPERA